MALFDDVNRKLQALGNSVTAIGEAAQSKGADLDPETTPLSEWADAINDIPIEAPVWKANEATGQLTRLIRQPEITYPTQATDGTPLSTTFNPNEQAIMYGMFFCEKIIIPEYFIQSNISMSNYLNYLMSLTMVKEIEINSLGTVSWANSGNLPYLQRVRCATSGYFEFEIKTQYKTIEGLNDATVIELPNATSARGLWGYNWNEALVDTVVINAPKLKQLGNPSGGVAPKEGRYWQGDNTFPELDMIRGLTNPGKQGFTNIIRAPKLTRTDSSFMWNAPTGGGKLALYIGPNFNSIPSQPLGWLPDQITAGIIEFHIPAGESTTKTYLDSKGISYIQDNTI